ncbi:molybdate ABC transporter substrate-binding protein [Nocardia caishijiensis]|uniref:Molybdate transport system substrate-binding protein n=1 Tax=Nocardia caishijiensis TaxID=184756 RepID=A0ABQ6YUN1_9NOCA|nr:molybdate ABC transporter substrate-binding protein [Nocardia caishijiensis]KAF0849509.1 molybdate transport system substrate-binding protein [Nocardia caishijiensis]
MKRALALGAALTVLAACGSETNSATGDATLTVFAAASLKKVFTDLEDVFETANPGVDVRFSFAGSSDLAAQLQAGAPADVFASADQPTMDKVVADGRIATSRAFATNVLTIITAPGNPKGISGFRDLAGDGVSVVTCAPQVPCGRATQKVAAAAAVTLRPVSEESSVADVLTKVTSGQADAGLVYVTDAAGAGTKVATVAIPEASAAVNTYPIGAVDGSGDNAEKFIELVTGPTGRRALTEAGFGVP